MSAAEAVLGRGKKRQPDWFLESEDKLLPLLKAKQAAHNRLLQDDSMTNRSNFENIQEQLNSLWLRPRKTG